MTSSKHVGSLEIAGRDREMRVGDLGAGIGRLRHGLTAEREQRQQGNLCDPHRSPDPRHRHPFSLCNQKESQPLAGRLQGELLGHEPPVRLAISRHSPRAILRPPQFPAIRHGEEHSPGCGEV